MVNVSCACLGRGGLSAGVLDSAVSVLVSVGALAATGALAASGALAAATALAATGALAAGTGSCGIAAVSIFGTGAGTVFGTAGFRFRFSLGFAGGALGNASSLAVSAGNEDWKRGSRMFGPHRIKLWTKMETAMANVMRRRVLSSLNFTG